MSCWLIGILLDLTHRGMWILNALAQYFSDLLASTFSTYVYIKVSLQ